MDDRYFTEEINYLFEIAESRTARAARYSETPMLVGVMSVLVSNVQ